MESPHKDSKPVCVCVCACMCVCVWVSAHHGSVQSEITQTQMMDGYNV